MSWDIFVQDIPLTAKSVSEIPANFEPRLLGTRAEIIARIRDVVPVADFTSPSWGLIEGAGFSIEVSMGNREEVRGFAFHVRGGEIAASVLADILQHLGFRAFDPSSETGMFNPGDSACGLRGWREYRDSIVDRTS